MAERPNKHHILFSRQRWETYPQGASLRNEKTLIPLMDADVHRELHRHIPVVPLIGYYALCRVRSEFKPSTDTLDDVEQLQRLIERSNRHPRAHSIEIGMANLAIQALDEQKPYLREGMAK